ncbi:MAG: 16S rRNA (guanine(527)-N(7))-methyltransferase RsmG [Clostridia bacterium]|nr:16S rRNA (guanine(527)-N(7))-methyltransferase RsmG [Clostridia bacterium]
MIENFNYSEYPEYLSEILCKNGLNSFSDIETCTKLSDFCKYLLEQNQLFNLTAIKTPESAALLHFADSLTLSEFIPQGSNILDIGSGAGFPAIPLAMARNDITVTALDSTQKRVDFINKAAKILGLTNLTAVCYRAEDVTGKEFSEHFDIVTARAVASYPILLELALPAVKVGGSFIAMKSKEVSRETQGIEKVLKTLCIGKPRYNQIQLQNDDEIFERCIVVIKKLSSTPPKYPRAYAQIKKRPIF